MIYVTDTVELKKRMIDKDIPTIVELSRVTGVNRNTLSSVLEGREQPSTYVIKQLMKVLGIQPEEAGVIFFSKKLTQ